MISTNNLTYAYARQGPTLENLDLNVPEGAIYGFLGANGAGKSTTIRLLLSLLKPTSGDVEVFGLALPKHRKAILARIGCLIESPALYPQLSARDNLTIAATYRQVDKARIDEVLTLVGLAEHGDKPTRKFSMGMKQRLGLALALLHDPELLILDEPTNGLDPSGIIEIRQLLLELRAAGKTIMLSSHLLGELEKIVSHLGILHGGQLVFEGTTNALVDRRKAKYSLEIQTPHVNLAAELAGLPAKEGRDSTDRLELQVSEKSAIPALLRRLVKGGVDLYAVRPLASDLESIFLQLTAEKN
ncbi:MAG: ABC transporter ATP-binding protein [Bacteroidota bacterium]